MFKRRAAHAAKEIAMAKAKKRVAARKKSSKRGKAGGKPVRKLAPKQGALKKTKSKFKRTVVKTKKPAAMKKQPLRPVKAMQVAAMPTETTTMDVIEKPAASVIAVTEHEAVQTTPVSTDG
jgi:hypothetical protein